MTVTDILRARQLAPGGWLSAGMALHRGGDLIGKGAGRFERLGLPAGAAADAPGGVSGITA